MDETLNRETPPKTANGDTDCAVKKQKTPSLKNDVVEEEGEEDVMLSLSLSENTIEELMNLLETDSVTKVRFIDDPYSSTLVFQPSSSYITINVNEETCGSSFSDSDSSVMASVDMNGLKLFPEWIFWSNLANLEVKQIDGCDGIRVWDDDNDDDDYFDDDLLAKFIGED